MMTVVFAPHHIFLIGLAVGLVLGVIFGAVAWR